MSFCSSSSSSSSSSSFSPTFISSYYCPTTSRTMTTLILNKKHKQHRNANDDEYDSTTTTTTTTTISRRRKSRFLFSFICLLSLFNLSYAAPTNVIDGLVIYSTDNKNQTTNFKEMSRNAFLSLTGKPVEARLPSYHITNNHHQHHHRKKHRGGNRRVDEKETILDGRKHALMQLADPEGLKMQTKCDGQKFKQRVRVDGCLTKVVVNRLCHGTCASYYIPRMHSHSKKLKAAFKSCATCAPSDFDFVDITLDCPGQNPPTATRTIVKVKSCKCREVSISSLYA